MDLGGSKEFGLGPNSPNIITVNNNAEVSTTVLNEVPKKENSQELEVLKYPYEGLGVDKGLKSYIRFAPVKETTYDLSNLRDALTGLGEALEVIFVEGTRAEAALAKLKAGTLDVEDAGDLLIGMTEGTINALKAMGGGVLDQLKSMKEAFSNGLEGKYGDYGDLISTDKKYQRPKDRGDVAIKLYMSPMMSYTDAVEVSAASLGMGDQAKLAAMGGKNISIGDTLNAGAGALGSALAGNPSEGANIAASIAAQKVGSSNKLFGKVLSPQVTGIGTRTAMGDHYRFIFKGVNFREFSFAFEMKAESKKEALEIRKIVKRFREELYPEKITGNFGTDGAVAIEMGYKYPDRFNIDMVHDNQPVFHKIKPCYLQSVVTTYNGSDEGMNAFREGYREKNEDGEPIGELTFDPISVSIKLDFKESEKINKQDIKDGY